MIIIAGPGQGAQKPGFLEPWLAVDGARDRLAGYSDVVGIDLAAAGTEWDAAAITDTAVAQPLIVSAGLLSLALLRERAAASATPIGYAGHSVGEFTAIAAAGVVTDDEALQLVAVRGRAMAEAAALEPTGMSAVLGGEEQAVLARLAELGLTPANRNGGGQIVAAGAVDALATLRENPPERAKVIPLAVAGAFHTGYMASASTALRDAAADVSPADPTSPLWTNRDGSRLSSGQEVIDAVVGQVASPVRWDLCMASFTGSGITGLIELAPAGTLTGIAKRTLPGVATVAVRTPSDLDAAVQLLAEGAQA